MPHEEEALKFPTPSNPIESWLLVQDIPKREETATAKNRSGNATFPDYHDIYTNGLDYNRAARDETSSFQLQFWSTRGPRKRSFLSNLDPTIYHVS
jgi:hypothetical protein